MITRLIFFAGILLLGLVPTFRAQTDAQVGDFSGTWMLKSKNWSGAFQPSYLEKQTFDVKLVIVHDKSSISIQETGIQPDGKAYQNRKIYYLDGSGESNSTPSGRFIEETKTILKGRKIIISGKVFDYSSKKQLGKITEEFLLSKDLKKLSNTKSMETSLEMTSIRLSNLTHHSNFTFERAI